MRGDGLWDGRLQFLTHETLCSSICSPSGGVYRNKSLPEDVFLKDGCYDAGIGYFDTRDDSIYSFGDNKFMREATEEEIEFFQGKASTSKNTAKGLPVEDEGKYDDDSGYLS